MKLEVWHGTNQIFDTFDRSSLGMNNSNEASRTAFFFAANPDTAWDYAEQAARHMIPQQLEHEARVAALLKQAEDASRARKFDDYERILLEVEGIETEAMQAEPSGSSLLLCHINVENPFEADGSDSAVFLDMAAVLRQAQADGHDAVILRGIHDTPSGTTGPDDHFAIFDASRIEIASRYASLEEAILSTSSPSPF